MTTHLDLVQRALRKLFEPAKLTFTEATSRPWASITFDGEELQFNMTLDDDPHHVIDNFLANIGQAELKMDGVLVADMTATRINRLTINLEIITVAS
jgi:hypothetical protein